MYVIRPILVTDDVLISTTLAEDDAPAWDAGATYDTGDRVIVVSTSLPKIASERWSVGQGVYWNATLAKATTTVIANARVGYVLGPAAKGDVIAAVSVHAVFESIKDDNTGINPVSDAAGAITGWVNAGSTNRWKPFDRVAGDPAVFPEGASAAATLIAPETVIAPETIIVTDGGGISYDLALPSLCDAVALFDLSGASVTVDVLSSAGVVVWSETQSLVDTSAITDWYEFFTWEPVYRTKAVFTGVPGRLGRTIRIRLTGTQMGEVVLGKLVQLGTTLVGTEVGFDDYSGKTRNDFGNVGLIERESSDTVTFRFKFPATDLSGVLRETKALRANPTAWIADPDNLETNAAIFGFPSGSLRVPLKSGPHHEASIQIEEMT